MLPSLAELAPAALGAGGLVLCYVAQTSLSVCLWLSVERGDGDLANDCNEAAGDPFDHYLR